MPPLPEIDWEVFGNFGLGGLILAVFFLLFLFFLWLTFKAFKSMVSDHKETVKAIVNRMTEDHKQTISRMSLDHRESNEAWRQTFAQYSTQNDVRQAETNTVLRNLTKVMAENNACLVQFGHKKSVENYQEAKSQ